MDLGTTSAVSAGAAAVAGTGAVPGVVASPAGTGFAALLKLLGLGALVPSAGKAPALNGGAAPAASGATDTDAAATPSATDPAGALAAAVAAAAAGQQGQQVPTPPAAGAVDGKPSPSAGSTAVATTVAAGMGGKPACGAAATAQGTPAGAAADSPDVAATDTTSGAPGASAVAQSPKTTSTNAASKTTNQGRALGGGEATAEVESAPGAAGHGEISVQGTGGGKQGPSAPSGRPSSSRQKPVAPTSPPAKETAVLKAAGRGTDATPGAPGAEPNLEARTAGDGSAGQQTTGGDTPLPSGGAPSQSASTARAAEPPMMPPPVAERAAPAPAAPHTVAMPPALRDVERLVQLDAQRPFVVRDGGEMRMTIEPQGLGHVELRVAVDANAVHATLTASHEQARDMLAQHRPQLEAALERSQLRLEGFSVNLGQHQQPRDPGETPRPWMLPTPGSQPTASPATATTPEPVRVPRAGGALSLLA